MRASDTTSNLQYTFDTIEIFTNETMCGLPLFSLDSELVLNMLLKSSPVITCALVEFDTRSPEKRVVKLAPAVRIWWGQHSLRTRWRHSTNVSERDQYLA